MFDCVVVQEKQRMWLSDRNKFYEIFKSQIKAIKIIFLFKGLDTFLSFLEIIKQFIDEAMNL